MRSWFAVVLGLLAVGCGAVPEVAKDRSAVYGTVTARPHKEVLAKWTSQSGGGGYGDAGRVRYPAEAINYDRLAGIHVGLIDPAHEGGAIHDIVFSAAAIVPETLAVALGDIIRIRNRTARPLTFFLAAAEGEGFQDIGRIPAGGSSEVRVGIEGVLDLGTDEDEGLVAPVMARRGLRSTATASGKTYLLDDLNPGRYRMIFWYWRLGSIERSVKLPAGAAVRVDEVLSVDRTVR